MSSKESGFCNGETTGEIDRFLANCTKGEWAGMACFAQRACTRTCSGVRTASVSAALLVFKPVAGRVLGNTLFVLALPLAATTPITFFLSRRVVLWREEVKTNE